MTISGAVITVRSNKKNRSFTIRKEGLKYRTDSFPKLVFERHLDNTADDWQSFLKYSNCYSQVK